MIPDAIDKAQALVARLQSDLDDLCAPRTSQSPLLRGGQVQENLLSATESAFIAALRVLPELLTADTTESNS